MHGNHTEVLQTLLVLAKDRYVGFGVVILFLLNYEYFIPLWKVSTQVRHVPCIRILFLCDDLFIKDLYKTCKLTVHRSCMSISKACILHNVQYIGLVSCTVISIRQAWLTDKDDGSENVTKIKRICF